MTTPISEIQWNNRQPEELDYLRPNGFRFLIQSLPKVTYFCQSANIPTINLGSARQATPLIDFPLPGEKLSFGELSIRFMIQEDMANYIELYNWMISLGFPDNHSQYGRRYAEQKYRDPNGNNNQPRKSDMTDYSDATLLVLGSDYNVVARLNFMDCFPISLSGVNFDVSRGETQYFAADVFFNYRVFTVESLTSRT